MSTHIKHIFLAAAATCFIGAAQASEVIINEIEPNHPIDSAQLIPIPASGTVSIQAMLGNGGEYDIDYFTFNALAGDNITFDIQNSSVSTRMAVISPGPDYLVLHQNSQLEVSNPLIENFKVAKSGMYFVAVAWWNRTFRDGNIVQNSTAPMRTGDYTLVISGVSPSPISESEPEPQHVAIIVRPGNQPPSNRGVIPVAILGDPDFNTLSIDTSTLTFGSTGNENSLRRCNVTGTDVNNSGRVDLICHFDSQAADFKPSDMEGALKGQTNDGKKFQGRGYLRVSPFKANGNSGNARSR